MSSQALEQVLEFVPTIRQESRAYQTIDVFTNGLSQMYTGKIQPIAEMGSNNGVSEGRIQPIGNSATSPSGYVSTPAYLQGAQERFRKPDNDPTHGYHMNYEVFIPAPVIPINNGIPIIRKPLSNAHIPMIGIHGY